MADVALVHVDQRRRLDDGVDQRLVLADVVGQHQLGHLGGHLGQQLVALLDGEVAVIDDAIEHDLDVDLVVGAVDTGRVVDGVVVDPAAQPGVLDAAPLGAAEIAALADHGAPQLVGVDPHAVVGLVPGVGVALGRRLDVGPDPTVPQQLDGCPQQGPDEIVRGRRLVLDIEQRPHLVGQRNRLGRPWEDAAARGQQRSVVVIPRRTGSDRRGGAARRTTPPGRGRDR